MGQLSKNAILVSTLYGRYLSSAAAKLYQSVRYFMLCHCTGLSVVCLTLVLFRGYLAVIWGYCRADWIGKPK